MLMGFEGERCQMGCKKLSKGQMIEFDKIYDFLLLTDYDEGAWTGLFDFAGGDNVHMVNQYNPEYDIIEVLAPCGDHYEFYGTVPADDESYLLRIVEFLVDGSLEDIPSDFML